MISRQPRIAEDESVVESLAGELAGEVTRVAPETPRPRGPRVFRLGEWLIRRALIDRTQLFRALSLADQERCRLGDALVKLGVLSRELVEAEVRTFLLTRPGTPPPIPAAALRERPPSPPLPPGPATALHAEAPLPVRGFTPARALPPPLRCLTSRSSERKPVDAAME